MFQGQCLYLRGRLSLFSRSLFKRLIDDLSHRRCIYRFMNRVTRLT